MSNHIPNPHFTDISDIHHKDISIDFSVEQILNHNEYLIVSPKMASKNKGKGTPKVGKNGSKKQNQRMGQNVIQEGCKQKKKLVHNRMKSKALEDEKDTQDNSITVKIAHCYTSTKPNPQKAGPRSISKSKRVQLKSGSNKIQPGERSRSRTKSISSVASNRKLSLIHSGQHFRTPISSQLASPRGTSSSSINKNRSNTIRMNKEQLKMKNENIVINDYFYQNEKGRQNYEDNDGKAMRKKSISIGKKITYQSKKLKKSPVLQEGLCPKSPKIMKK